MVETARKPKSLQPALSLVVRRTVQEPSAVAKVTREGVFIDARARELTILERGRVRGAVESWLAKHHMGNRHRIIFAHN